jgi:predicted nucleic acid-binding Zn ribbon protein
MRKHEDGIPIKKAIDGYFKAMGLDDKMLETKALSNWSNLMGEAVAKRTKTKYIKDRILFVELTSSVMREELMLEKSKIIDKFNGAAGKELIDDLYFR